MVVWCAFYIHLGNKILTAQFKAIKPWLSLALKKPRPEAGPSQGQAPNLGLGSAWGFRKPEPPQAEPKLGLPGQAGPENP